MVITRREFHLTRHVRRPNPALGGGPPAEDVAAYVAARPGAESETIPDAAHLAFVDNAAATADAIRRFLRKVEA